MNLEVLTAPMTDEEVQWRVGQVMVWDGVAKVRLLAYIDARAGMRRLDEAVGPTGWQDAYREAPHGGVVCSLSLLTEHGWIAKEDIGVPSQTEAEKGEFSDAFKRACVKWGIGRDLYELRDELLTVQDRKPQDVPYRRLVRVNDNRKNVKGWVVAPPLDHVRGTAPAPRNGTHEPQRSQPPRQQSTQQQRQPTSQAGPPSGTVQDACPDWPIPPCPTCGVPGERKPKRDNPRAPAFSCANGCTEPSRDGKKQWPKSYWRASEKQWKAIQATREEFAKRNGISIEDVKALISAKFGTHLSSKTYSGDDASTVLDWLKGNWCDADAQRWKSQGAEAFNADEGGHDDEPYADGSQDDIPF